MSDLFSMMAANADDRPGRRKTRRSVIIADRIADWVIRIGGISVILAVAGIMLFLAEVVVPLFTGAHVGAIQSYLVASMDRGSLAASIDEHKTVAVVIQPDGRMVGFHVQTGAPLEVPSPDLGGKRPTAVGQTLNGESILIGFEDGTVRFATLRIAPTVIGADQVPANLRRLDQRDQTDGRVVISSIPGNQFRRTDVRIAIEPPQKLSERPIIAADYRTGGTVERPTRSFVTVDADGVARLSRAESRMNLMTRQMRTSIDTTTMPDLPAGVQVKSVLLTNKADAVLIAARDGTVFRFDTRDFRAPKLAETTRLLPEGEQLTGFQFLIGEQSLVVTGSKGTTDVFFTLERANSGTPDNLRLTRAHSMERHAGAVNEISPSLRGKTFATADVTGAVWVRHSTSNQTLLKLEKDGAVSTYAALVLTPRNDGVLAIAGDGRARFWNVDAPHPETTLQTIFGRVWYEGYQSPVFTWQSSAGTDQFEPKLSLIPLIFGTLKATFYALLFAVPIALLAALYTSEFLQPRVRAVVKPAMEMMASLPSVVLGFIAALILAPIVEDWISAVLMAFLALPISLLIAAYLWQLLPRAVAIRYGGALKFVLIFATVVASFQLCVWLGGMLERIVFAGDIKLWLTGSIGQGTAFLSLMFLPFALLVVSWASSRAFDATLDGLITGHSRIVVGSVAIMRWAMTMAVALALAWLAAWLLTSTGYDPRGSLVDTYVQRNTLVVSFAMSFAVIPIIYTIAEDALNSVPEHLRGASLACGASTWQTATRVILPTAMSGVFAAIMIGMGRAVGETMIVVMAAGNTPILEWNIFNGLRALSANIAVELPEAVRDGTLYRMLFLAALLLFVMTFVINTIAETIRQRFRRRAASL
ncbi:MAG: ABC transporter permease subunit [Rhizobiales bacterium]|nr:ABC transporter permease subunit [Hyphomicrobiales bacterium]